MVGAGVLAWRLVRLVSAPAAQPGSERGTAFLAQAGTRARDETAFRIVRRSSVIR